MTAKKKGQKVTKRQIWLAVSAVAIGLVAVAICWAFRWARKKQEIVYPLDYEQELLSAADEFSIDPCLLAALVYCESSFRPDAVSSVGAVGLMQIMPETGRWLSGKIELDAPYDDEMLYDPATNLRLGCWYLDFLHKRYDGRLAGSADVLYRRSGTGGSVADRSGAFQGWKNLGCNSRAGRQRICCKGNENA